MEAIDWKFWIQAFLAGAAALYTALEYHRGGQAVAKGGPEMRRPFVAVGALLVLTWAAIVFDYYDRHHAPAGSYQQMFSQWGTDGKNVCLVSLDATRVLNFRKQYEIALVCGIVDPAIDILNETRIGVGASYHIIPSQISMIARMRKEMTDAIVANSQPQVWYMPILVPQGTDMTNIRSLSDVRRYGGKLLHPLYFE